MMGKSIKWLKRFSPRKKVEAPKKTIIGVLQVYTGARPESVKHPATGTMIGTSHVHKEDFTSEGLTKVVSVFKDGTARYVRYIGMVPINGHLAEVNADLTIGPGADIDCEYPSVLKGSTLTTKCGGSIRGSHSL
jgi:hypothetical protein